MTLGWTDTGVTPIRCDDCGRAVEVGDGVTCARCKVAQIEGAITEGRREMEIAVTEARAAAYAEGFEAGKTAALFGEGPKEGPAA